MKPAVLPEDFFTADIRVGRIRGVEIAQTKKEAYRLTIDFGPEIGTKVSCGAFRHYLAEELLETQVVAVVNFPAKQMGPEKSEVLVLGTADEEGKVVLLRPRSEVPEGSEVF